MSRIRIRYDHLGQRWSVERVGDEARHDLLPERGRDDLHIARDPQGAIVEVVADAAVPDEATLDLVAAAFGTAARAVLLARPDRDLDTVLDTVDSTPDATDSIASGGTGSTGAGRTPNPADSTGGTGSTGAGATGGTGSTGAGATGSTGSGAGATGSTGTGDTGTDAGGTGTASTATGGVAPDSATAANTGGAADPFGDREPGALTGPATRTPAGRPGPILIAAAADRPPALPGEPGVPAVVPTQPHVYRIPPDPADSDITTPAVLEHHLGEAEVVVRVPGHLAGGPFWVRVADGTTGIVLALGRLAAGADAAGAAEMRATLTFALDVPLDALHVAVSAEPLTVPTDRDTRRRRWADALEREAEAAAATADTDAAAAAWQRAAEVRDALGDHDTAAADRARARATTHRASARQRRRWIGIGAAGVLLVALLVWLLAAFARSDDGGAGTESSDSAATTAPVTQPTSPPTTRRPPITEFRITNPGPERLRFDDDPNGLAALVAITGDAAVRPGSELSITIQAEVPTTVTYLRRVDCVNAAVGQSSELTSGDGPMLQPTFTPVLELIVAAGEIPERRTLSPVTVDRREALIYPRLEACDVFPADDTPELHDIPGFVRLVPTEAVLRLPADLLPGSYQVNLDHITDAGVLEADPIVFQVLPAD